MKHLIFFDKFISIEGFIFYFLLELEVLPLRFVFDLICLDLDSLIYFSPLASVFIVLHLNFWSFDNFFSLLLNDFSSREGTQYMHSGDFFFTINFLKFFVPSAFVSESFTAFQLKFSCFSDREIFDKLSPSFFYILLAFDLWKLDLAVFTFQGSYIFLNDEHYVAYLFFIILLISSSMFDLVNNKFLLWELVSCLGVCFLLFIF